MRKVPAARLVFQSIRFLFSQDFKPQIYFFLFTMATYFSDGYANL